MGMLVPVAVLAAGGTFTDDDDSIFEADIEWMAANGITLGCNPPTNDHYCPDDVVTRGQMAAFMHRLGVKNDGFSVFHDASLQITGTSSFETVLELTGLPAGSYVIIAKTHIQSHEGANTSAVCRLVAGVDFDQTNATLEPFHHVPATWTVVHSFASDGSAAQLQCEDFGSDVTLQNTKITAIGVNNINNNPG
jgi:hypothetical protein